MEFTYTVRNGLKPEQGRLSIGRELPKVAEGWNKIEDLNYWIYYGWFVVIFQYEAKRDKADYPPMIIHVVYEGFERSDEMAKQALRYALNALRTRMIAAGLYLD